MTASSCSTQPFGEPGVLQMIACPRIAGDATRQPAERVDQPHRLGQPGRLAFDDRRVCPRGSGRAGRTRCRPSTRSDRRTRRHLAQRVGHVVGAVGGDAVLDDRRSRRLSAGRPARRRCGRHGCRATTPSLTVSTLACSGVSSLMRDPTVPNQRPCRRCRHRAAAPASRGRTAATRPTARPSIGSNRRASGGRSTRPRSACTRCRRADPPGRTSGAAAPMMRRCRSASSVDVASAGCASGRRRGGAAHPGRSTARRSAPCRTHRRRERRRTASATTTGTVAGSRRGAVDEPARSAQVGDHHGTRRRHGRRLAARCGAHVEHPLARARHSTRRPPTATEVLHVAVVASVTGGGSFIRCQRRHRPRRPARLDSRSTIQSG